MHKHTRLDCPSSATVCCGGQEQEVATAVVVCVVCSFTAGLLLGVLLTQCHGHCHRKQKRGQTEISPVYEDITLEKTPPAIELHSNDAYMDQYINRHTLVCLIDLVSKQS